MRVYIENSILLHVGHCLEGKPPAWVGQGSMATGALATLQEGVAWLFDAIDVNSLALGGDCMHRLVALKARDAVSARVSRPSQAGSVQATHLAIYPGDDSFCTPVDGAGASTLALKVARSLAAARCQWRGKRLKR